MTPLDASVFGLPLHPLVVHAVVVLLPLGALGLIALVVAPRWRAAYSPLVLGVVSAGALASVVAKLSGEALALTETLPERHAAWGTWLMAASLALMVVAWLWWWLERRAARGSRGQDSFGAIVAGALVVGLAGGVATLTLLTGHTGADAVWGSGRAAPAAVPGAGASPGATASPAATASGLYTLADGQQHATATSCWAVVDGGVYDLTGWVGSHPGGAGRILNLCGTDATTRFRTQHDTSARPNTQLARFRIGTLA